MPSRQLIAALDYGVSNSGAAYSIVHDDDEHSPPHNEPDVIKDWPRGGASRDPCDKVPSEVAYDEHGQPVGHGFAASQHAAALQWVKLLLEPDSFKEQSNKTAQVWTSYYALDSYGLKKTPVEVVADYLKWLWETVKAAIVEKEAEAEDTELFEPAHLTVVLTVPASWSSLAKQRMVTAAIMAGIPEQCLKTLAEPEAAAVFGLRKQASKRQISDEDCVIVCDAGGGTVDVVAYQVRKREPLSLVQITISNGDFCGSSFVNKEFKSQLQSILGDKYDMLDDEVKDRIDEEFEYTIKRTYNPFDGRSSSSYYIPVGGLDDDEGLEIRHGKMRLDNAVIDAAFDSVMTQIGTLLDIQIAKIHELGLFPKLKGLLLVGGFGRSGFLRHRIRQEFPGRNSLKIWPADDSWTAVVRGAVAFEASTLGRQALIHSRLSGYHYGVPWKDGATRKVHWLVRKGQSVQSDMPMEPYALRIDDQPWLDEDEYCLVYVPIVTCSDYDAGDEYTDKVAPHATIKCRVPTAIRFSHRSALIKGSPTRAWHIPATLVLYFDGALMSFRCSIGDREVGVAEVRYFAEEADCETQADPASKLKSAQAAQVEKHPRKDSKTSFVSDSSSEGNLYQALAAFEIDKETATKPAPHSSTSGAQAKDSWMEKKRGSQHWTSFMRTRRDTPQDHRHRHRFLAPSAASELPVEERLNMVYRKHWEPRKDSR